MLVTLRPPTKTLILSRPPFHYDAMGHYKVLHDTEIHFNRVDLSVSWHFAEYNTDYNMFGKFSEKFFELVCTDLYSIAKCGHCTAVLKYFDRLLILTSPTIHYDACQCNFATDFFSGIFRQNEQRRYLRVGFVL